MPRTTINLPDNLLKQAKLEAARRNVPLQQVVTEGLELKFGRFPKSILNRKFKFRSEKLGLPKSTFRRKDIYEDIIKHRTGH